MTVLTKENSVLTVGEMVVWKMEFLFIRNVEADMLLNLMTLKKRFICIFLLREFYSF
jgi:hypothetical protein